ncbi:hypothetical protein ACK3TF_005156 [Chlorella vulgaris]
MVIAIAKAQRHNAIRLSNNVRQAARRQPLLALRQGTVLSAVADTADTIPAEQSVSSPSRPHDSEAAIVAAAFRVTECHLQPGEHLRVVGSCTELGAWDAAAAPALTWQPGNSWAADLVLPLGSHSFKLVVVRQDCSFWWEEGANRELPAPCLAAGTPVAITCQWGNPAAITVAADPAHLQAAADAAAARLEVLQEERQQLAREAARWEQEVQQSEAAIADKEREVAKLLSAAQAAAVAQAASDGASIVSNTGTGISTASPGTGAAQGVEAHAAAASPQQDAAEAVGKDLQPAPAVAADTNMSHLSASSVEGRVGEAVVQPPEHQHEQSKQQPHALASILTATSPARPEAAAPRPQAPAHSAAHEQPSALGGSRRQEHNGLISFSFSAPSASTSSSIGDIAELSLTAGELAEQRLLGRLPPQAAEGLRQRLRRVSASSDGSSSSSSSNGASKSGSKSGSQDAHGSTLPTVSTVHEVRAAKGRGSQLTPSTRSGVALGGPVQPSAASSGGGDWEAQQPHQKNNKMQQRKTQPEQVEQQGHTKAGSSSLAPGNEPPSASTAAGEGVPPLTPPPEPQQLLPAMLLLKQQRERQQQQQQQQGEAARPPSSSAGAAPLAPLHRSSSRHPDVAMRPTLPIAAASLVVSAIYDLGSTVWGVGRAVLPPDARRPADVAFWLLFSTAVLFPLWR